MALAERRSTWRKQYAGRPILMVLPLSRLDLASSKSFRVITPSDAKISPLHRHASKKASHTCEAFNSVVEVFMEFERLGGFPRESDFEKEPAREVVLEVVSALYVNLGKQDPSRMSRISLLYSSYMDIEATI
nr:hypothetical protein Iba_chr05eCG5920 [Ipomoea batatas]